MYQPRMLSDGRICCSTDYALCDQCKTHRIQQERHMSLTSIADDKVELARAAEARLRRALPRTMAFKSIADIDAETGTGVVITHQNGREVTRKFTFELDGEVFVLKSIVGVRLTTAEDYTPEDPYAAGIAQLKTTSASPLSTFAERYAAERLRGVTATRTALDAEEPQPRMAAEALAPYRAPDIYAAGIKALQESR